MKLSRLILFAAAAVLPASCLCSCGNTPWVFSTPYGSVINTSKGTTYVPPEPIAARSGK